MTKEHPITVLQLCEHFGGKKSTLHGVARGFQWWLPLFDTQRYRVLLCSRRGYDAAAQQMIDSGITPLYLGYHPADPRNLLRLIRIVREEKVDIIHAHGYGSSIWAHLAGMLLKKPVIIHERCNYKTVPFYLRPVERFFGPLTRHALAVSESSRQFCIHKRYMRPEVVETLYNGIPHEDITIQSSAWIADERTRRGAKPETLVVGVVCRLAHYKGLIDACQAIEKVIASIPNVQLWIAGDGPYEGELQHWIDAHGMHDHVKLLGFVRNIRDVMQCFDLQLFPSHQEGTPNALYEAMVVGHPIVASTTDGQGEILEHEKTALLFEPGDVETMAAHLTRVLGDTPLRKQLAAQAKERGKDFEGQKCIDRLQAKYDEIMAGTAPDSKRRPGVRKGIALFLKGFVAVACLAIIFQKIGTNKILEQAVSIRFIYVLAAIGIGLLNRFLVAWRWYILLKARDIHATFMEIVRINFVSNFVGILMPLSLGVDAIRLYQIQKTKRDISNTSGTLIADRLIAVVVLCAMSCIGVALSWNSFPDHVMLESVLIVSLLGIASIMALTADTTYRIITNIAQRIFSDSTTGFGKISKKMTDCHRAIGELTYQPKSFIPVAAVTVMVQVFRMFTIHLLLKGVGITPELTHEIAFVPIIILIGLLPITPMGLGVKEGAFIYFFSVVGHDPSALVTASLYSHVTTLMSALPGAYYFMIAKKADAATTQDAAANNIVSPPRGGQTQLVEIVKEENDALKNAEAQSEEDS